MHNTCYWNGIIINNLEIIKHFERFVLIYLCLTTKETTTQATREINGVKLARNSILNRERMCFVKASNAEKDGITI